MRVDSLGRAATVLTDALKAAKLGGRVVVQQMLWRDAIRFAHEPSGFAREYEMGRDGLVGIVEQFMGDLCQELLRDETEVLTLYQEPHVVRL